MTKSQELGLVAGIPVGTSLIDAHAGGVGVMESVHVSRSETEGRYEILSTVYLYYYVPHIFLYFILSAD